MKMLEEPKVVKESISTTNQVDRQDEEPQASEWMLLLQLQFY
jgi:hypothetical protein